MKKIILLAFLILMFIGCTTEDSQTDGDETGDSDTIVASDIDPEQQINFPDPVLRVCIEKLVGKSSGASIYVKDVANIKKVECDGVSDLTGMEYFAKVDGVIFNGSKINSLSQLSGLNSLTYIYIEGGGVKNFNNISTLSNITDIEYSHSELEDISAIAGYEKLKTIFLRDNNINNISSLATLKNIETIYVTDDNKLVVLGAKFTAPKLNELNLSNCGIKSLDELNGLPELASINAQDNYLTDVSIVKTLPKLKSIAIKGNCLTDEAIKEYVDWFNINPVISTTYEEVYAGQNYPKCQ